MDVSTPACGEHEILVRVLTTTVNRTDCAMLRAKPFIMRFLTGLFKPKNPILGTDFAGEVETVGKNVESYTIGDRIFGFGDEGLSSHAQYLSISPNKAIAKIPDNQSFQEAVACLEGAHYAINMYNKIKLKPGHRVLVNGATGAIGSAALQLGVYYGATVDAVCNTKNVDLIRSLGASNIFNYEKQDFTKSGEKYDFILDAVGKSTFGLCKPLLNPGGVYMSSELGPGGQKIFYALFTPLFSNNGS